MRIALDYGKTGLQVDIPDRNLVGPLNMRPVEPLTDPENALRTALEKPIGSAPLAELARGKKSACILICDITRPVPNAFLLPPIPADSGAAGHPARENPDPDRHRAASPECGDELVELVGPEIASELPRRKSSRQTWPSTRFSATRPAECPRGSTHGTSQADLKIATGLIEPHLMAGYSGGRKLICPGIAALETVKIWHGPDFLEHPKADCGFLDGQPRSRGKHAHRPDGGLRFHRQRVARQGSADHVARRRRHGTGICRRESSSWNRSARRTFPSPATSSSRRAPVIRSTRPFTRRSRG